MPRLLSKRATGRLDPMSKLGPAVIMPPARTWQTCRAGCGEARVDDTAGVSGALRSSEQNLGLVFSVGSASPRRVVRPREEFTRKLAVQSSSTTHSQLRLSRLDREGSARG